MIVSGTKQVSKAPTFGPVCVCVCVCVYVSVCVAGPGMGGWNAYHLQHIFGTFQVEVLPW